MTAPAPPRRASRLPKKGVTNAEVKMKIRPIEKATTSLESSPTYCKRTPIAFLHVCTFLRFEEFGDWSLIFAFSLWKAYETFRYWNVVTLKSNEVSMTLTLLWQHQFMIDNNTKKMILSKLSAPT